MSTLFNRPVRHRIPFPLPQIAKHAHYHLRLLPPSLMLGGTILSTSVALCGIPYIAPETCFMDPKLGPTSVTSPEMGSIWRTWLALAGVA